jgi:hypothetical protein
MALVLSLASTLPQAMAMPSPESCIIVGKNGTKIRDLCPEV